jgi:four helix bundle protein
MRDFRKLVVWREAHEPVLEVYAHTTGFPRSELYGLATPMRRAAVSIPANIAEGYAHQGDKALVRYQRIAQSSSSELSDHLLLGRDLGYLDREAYKHLSGRLREVQSMLIGLANKVSGRASEA